jgi:hypothetical protein
MMLMWPCVRCLHLIYIIYLLTSRVATAAPTSQPFTAVATPEELYAAIKRGDKHIEIREHMVLSRAELGDSRDEDYLFSPKPTTASIRVWFSFSRCFV